MDQKGTPPQPQQRARSADAEIGESAVHLSEPKVASLAGDILYGADAIADFLYGDKSQRRSVYHHIANGDIPHFRIGSMICARRTVLLAWIAGQEQTRPSVETPPVSRQ